MLRYDWLIITIPAVYVLYMGVYSRRYLKDVTTFLSAGRVCGHMSPAAKKGTGSRGSERPCQIT